MQQRIAVMGLILLVSRVGHPAMASAQVPSEGLQPDEYNTAALIFNEELSALGDRALYPICINTPSGTPLKPLVQYLRRGGYPISDLSVCVPNSGRDGNHPKDYLHGLQILIGNPQRHPVGQIDMRVEAGDLTVRPGDHFAITLRRGIYHFGKNEEGEWQITGYTKEYDSREEKVNCDVGRAGRE
jgi:hypothetical protein